MASYLSSWWNGSTVATPSPVVTPPPPPVESATITIEEPHDSDNENDKADSEDDRPPAFPALSSIQRSGGPSTSSPKTKGSMAPPSFIPNKQSSVSSSGGSGLALPLTTIKRPPNVNSKAKARAKVALAPGHSPLDWARLKSSGEDLRAGVTSLQRITPSELKLHNKADDAWSAFGGKVYNITPYLAFHPGGEKELMRVAGRDGTKLFALTHSWVNLDFMLDGCMVGFLVPESS